jgi:hypothetical protein
MSSWKSLLAKEEPIEVLEAPVEPTGSSWKSLLAKEEPIEVLEAPVEVDPAVKLFEGPASQPPEVIESTPVIPMTSEEKTEAAINDQYAKWDKEGQLFGGPDKMPTLTALKESMKDPNWTPDSQTYGDASSEEQQAMYDLMASEADGGTDIRPAIRGAVIPAPWRTKFSEGVRETDPFFHAFGIEQETTLSNAIANVIEFVGHGESQVMEAGVEAAQEIIGTGLLAGDDIAGLFGANPELKKKFDSVTSTNIPKGLADEAISVLTRAAIAKRLTTKGGAKSISKALGETFLKPSMLTNAMKLAKFDAFFAIMSNKTDEMGWSNRIREAMGVEDLGLGIDSDELNSKLNIFLEALFMNGVMEVAYDVAVGTKNVASRYGGSLASLVKDTDFMRNRAATEVLGGVLKEAPDSIDKGEIVKLLAGKLQVYRQQLVEGTGKPLTTPQLISSFAKDKSKEVQKKITKLQTELESKGDVKSQSKELAVLEKERVYWDKQAVDQISGQESSIYTRGDMPQTNTVLRTQDDSLIQNLDENEELFGGTDSTDHLKNRLTTAVDNRVRGAFEAADKHSVTIENLRGQLQDITKDSDFFRVLANVSKDTGVDIHQNVNTNIDKVVGVLQEVFYKMDKVKNDKYSAYYKSVDGLPLPEGFFDEKYMELIKDTDFRKRLESGELSTGEVLNKTKEYLNGKINWGRVLPEHEVLNHELKDFKTLIDTDYLEGLSKSSNPKALEAARLGAEAKTYFEEDYLNSWGEGDFKVLAEKFKGMGGKYDSGVSTQSKEARILVENMLSAKSREHGKNVARLMKEGGNEAAVGTYLKSQAAAVLIHKMQKSGGKIADLDGEDIRGAFNNIVAQNPELRDQIEPFYAKFLDLRGDLVGQTKLLDDALKEGADLERSLQEEAFATFYTKRLEKATFGAGHNSRNMASSRSAVDIFSEILASDTSEDQVKKLIQEMTQAGDKEALRGLKSAYYRHLKDTALTGGSELKEEAARHISENNFGDLGLGYTIFKDNPEVIETTELIMEFMADLRVTEGQARKQVMKRHEPISKTQSEGMAVVKIAVTAVYGILSHAATMWKTGATVTSGLTDPYQRYLTILDSVYADPETFMSIINSNTVAPKEKVTLLRQFMTKGIVTPNVPPPEEKSETEEAMSVQ